MAAVMVRRRIVPPASAFTPAAYIGSAGDGSPTAELDRLATGTTNSATSLRTDAFASSTSPTAINDAERIAASALGLQGDRGMGSWLSEALRSPIAATAAALIPGAGTALSSALTAYQSLRNQGAAPQQAVSQVASQYQLSEADRALLTAAAANQQPATDYKKIALIGGGAILGLLVLSRVMK